MRAVTLFLGLLLAPAFAPEAGADQTVRLPLRTGWSLQSAALVRADGATLSRPGVDTRTWHAVTVPNTVVGALVENGTYPDPYFGMNLRKIPGTTYPIGERFTNLPMPADSPFKPSWWYRTEFDLPADGGERVWLHFDGINYREHLAERHAHRRADRRRRCVQAL
jgi:exo-1,4-beta-D-glucosaminidase